MKHFVVVNALFGAAIQETSETYVNVHICMNTDVRLSSSMENELNVKELFACLYCHLPFDFYRIQCWKRTFHVKSAISIDKLVYELVYAISLSAVITVSEINSCCVLLSYGCYMIESEHR